MKKEVTAIIVGRKGSKRIKSKCLLMLNDETLIERKIRQLQRCSNISRVVFGSDSDEMLEIAKNAGAEVVKRPDYYCNESLASANEMISNMCELIKTDVVVWAHCTNPLISSETYDKAVQVFLDKEAINDSLLSVVKFQEHLWDNNKKPLNYNPYSEVHVCARDLPVYYMQDGGIFIQPYLQMCKNKYFFGKKPILFAIPDDEFLDINIERDYLLAKAILERNVK